MLWLYDGLVDKLSPSAVAAIEAGRLIVPGMAELELAFLHEIGRVAVGAAGVVGTLASEIGLQRSEIPFAAVVAEARLIDGTRDPFDRLICAETAATGGRLVTRDQRILERFALALW